MGIVTVVPSFYSAMYHTGACGNVSEVPWVRVFHLTYIIPKNIQSSKKERERRKERKKQHKNDEKAQTQVPKTNSGPTLLLQRTSCKCRRSFLRGYKRELTPGEAPLRSSKHCQAPPGNTFGPANSPRNSRKCSSAAAPRAEERDWGWKKDEREDTRSATASFLARPGSAR